MTAGSSRWTGTSRPPHPVTMRSRDVADRIVAGCRGLEVPVHLDEAAVIELDAAFLEADALSVHGAARRHQDDRHLDLLGRAASLDLQRHLVLADGALLYLGPRDHLDPALPVTLRHGVRALGVLKR